MQSTLIDQGLTLMLVGMGTVFVFLTVLVAAMSLMAVIVRRFIPVTPDAGTSDEEVAAIAAALTLHRKTRSST